MGRTSKLRPRDVDALRAELAPFVARLRYLSKLYGLSIPTLIKHASLPDPIPVRGVEVPGFSEWNDRVAGL